MGTQEDFAKIQADMALNQVQAQGKEKTLEARAIDLMSSAALEGVELDAKDAASAGVNKPSPPITGDLRTEGPRDVVNPASRVQDALGDPRLLLGALGGGPQLIQQARGDQVPEQVNSTSRTTSVGPEEVAPGIRRNVGRTQETQRTQDNALSPGQALQGRVQELKAQAAQEKERFSRSEKLKDRVAGVSDELFGKISKNLPPELRDDLEIRRSALQEKRSATGSVTVMTADGAKVIPRSELPSGGLPAVPRAAPKTVVNNVIPGNKPATKTIQSQLQEDILGGGARLEQYDKIAQNFRPEFLQTFNVLALESADKLVRLGAPVPSFLPGREERDRYNTFKTHVKRNLNDYVKFITGAQMSAAEFDRLKDSISNLDDSAEGFVSKSKAVISTLKTSMMRQHMVMNDGFGDEMIQAAIKSSGNNVNDMYKKITMSDTRRIAGERAEGHLADVQQEHPDWTLVKQKHEAKQRTNRDFGF